MKALISCLVVAALLGLPAEVRAQTPPSSGRTAASAAPPPPLSGVYIRGKGGGLGDIPKAPFTPRGAEVHKNAPSLGLDTGPSSRCLPPGITFLMLIPYAFEIIQIPGRVLTYHEFGNYVRQIFTDGRDHGEAYPTWLGHSIGRYEGDTLVVDTVGFNGKGWLDTTGVQASDALHAVERFRRTTAGLEYSITVEDPKMFTRPFTVEHTFTEAKNFNIQEFGCLDNNMYLGSPGMQIQGNK